MAVVVLKGFRGIVLSDAYGVVSLALLILDYMTNSINVLFYTTRYGSINATLCTTNIYIFTWCNMTVTLSGNWVCEFMSFALAGTCECYTKW